MTTLRAAFGVPEAPAFYLWTLSLWVLAFGHAWWRQAPAFAPARHR